MRRVLSTTFRLVWLPLVVLAVAPHSRSEAADGTVLACTEFLNPQQEIRGKLIGPDACKMIETDFAYQGRKYRRMDMGVSGTIDGMIPKEGRYSVYFGSNPEFSYPQSGNTNPLLHGIGRYEADKGSALVFVYPVDRAAWNGKMFVTAHGRGRSFESGSLRAWDKNLSPDNPITDLSKYERSMIAKGYALAKTYRSTPEDGGDTVVTLEDGTVFTNRNVTEQPRLIMGWAQIGWNVLAKRHGSKPTRTYWYGRSGGARPGRIVNAQPGLNVGLDGKHIIDGIISDDSGSGLWVPQVLKNGKNVLFTEEEALPWFVVENKSFKIDPKLFSGAKHKDWFVPQFDLHHILYDNETSDDPPDWVSTNFLMNKRLNAKHLIEMGLGSKFRAFEIAAVSHDGGETAPENDPRYVHMDYLMDAWIDMLDAWVEKGVVPPASKFDWMEMGDLDKDGINENGAIQLPEVACPLGVFHTFAPPRGGAGNTGFTPFDGNGLEPFDRRGRVGDGLFHYEGYTDMNRSGTRDFKETVTQAWQRLGLLKPTEKFTRDHYVACIDKVAERLAADRFLLPKAVAIYREKARAELLPMQ